MTTNKRAELINQINRQYKVVKRKYEATAKSGEVDNFLKNQRAKFGALTNTKNTKTIALGSLSKLSTRRLEELARQQQLFINSRYTSAKGRREIAKNQYEGMLENYPTLTRKQFNIIQKVFGDKNKIAEMRENKGYSSGQVLDIATHKGATITKIQDAINIITKRDDYEQLKAYEVRDMIIAYIEAND